ncbi:DUF255 domain-containing protein [Piscinibacter sakaiensis]|uniref:DUF255 domain-containing protein n=1 Tax=Piscinibacter sakaiensis TaxID=1547922 RepID=UPI003AABACE8
MGTIRRLTGQDLAALLLVMSAQAPLAAGAPQPAAAALPDTQRSPATRHRDASGQPRFANALVRERSPYLRDYAHSPIDWLPWGGDADAKARTSGALKFISIGYSSCHWCHVMARESFDDLAIAEVLNRGFVSIKIDSEERPDVDRRFLAWLETLGVAPGWPMNLVLTPDGEVIWGATYLSRDELLATLRRLENHWRTDRQRLRELATANAERHRRSAQPPAAALAVGEAYAQTVQRIAADFDPVDKGFGTGRKFPAPAEVGVLRDAFLRSGDAAHARKLVETLRAIAGGGLSDPIDGGVFRYSIARSWKQPHFEKMLYDQAQVGRLLCQGLAISGDAALGAAAGRIIDFSLTRFSTGSGLFAASFDSESAGAEGAFYLWSFDDEDRLAAPLRPLLERHFDSVMQSNGGMLLVPASGAGPVPDKLLNALRRIRASHPAPRRDDKAITAWNANMVATLAECAPVLNRPELALKAATRMRRLLAINAKGGVIRRYSLGGQAAHTGSIEDLAWLLAALTALHDADGKPRWIAAARQLLQRNLPADRAALDQALDTFARDRTGLSASAVLLRSLTQLARRSDEREFVAARDRVAHALHRFAGADNHAWLTAALHEIEEPAPAPVVFAAAGRVRLTVAASPAPAGGAHVVVTADIRPGWHINSDRPMQDYLRPTRIAVAGAADAKVAYPPGKPLRFGSAGDLLLVLDGSARFDVRLPDGRPAGDFPLVRLSIALQTCSDRVCLAPETVQLAGLAGVVTRTAGR